MNKEKIKEYIEELNKHHYIKIDGADKERLIFDNDITFEMFGKDEHQGILSPFNDYTYKWLSSFFYRINDYIRLEDWDSFDELEENLQDTLSEWVDSETDIYNSDLTKWLADNNNNICYLDEVFEERLGVGEGSNALMVAQYKAIEELFGNALNELMDKLREMFENDNQNKEVNTK